MVQEKYPRLEIDKEKGRIYTNISDVGKENGGCRIKTCNVRSETEGGLNLLLSCFEIDIFIFIYIN